MTMLNNDRKKHARSKNCNDSSHDAATRKADDAFCRLEKGGLESNLPVFRIPRKPCHEDCKSNSASVDPRCERKKVNFGPDTSLKTDTQKHFYDKPYADSTIRYGVKHSRPPVSKLYTSHSTSAGNTSLDTGSHPSDNLTVALHSRSAKSCSDLTRNEHVYINKQWQHSSAVVNDSKATAMQLDPQETTPKLPEELIRAGWKLCWSKQRNRRYVFNVRTGTSSWDVPK